VGARRDVTQAGGGSQPKEGRSRRSDTLWRRRSTLSTAARKPPYGGVSDQILPYPRPFGERRLDSRVRPTLPHIVVATFYPQAASCRVPRVIATALRLKRRSHDSLNRRGGYGRIMQDPTCVENRPKRTGDRRKSSHVNAGVFTVRRQVLEQW
jgi:hypothetical protein